MHTDYHREPCFIAANGSWHLPTFQRAAQAHPKRYRFLYVFAELVTHSTDSRRRYVSHVDVNYSWTGQ